MLTDLKINVPLHFSNYTRIYTFKYIRICKTTAFSWDESRIKNFHFVKSHFRMNEIRHTFDIVRKNTDFLQQQEPEIIAKPIWLIFSLALLSFQSSPLHNMNEAHNIKSCNYCFLFFLATTSQKVRLIYAASQKFSFYFCTVGRSTCSSLFDVR